MIIYQTGFPLLSVQARPSGSLPAEIKKRPDGTGALIFLDYLDFQIVERNLFDEAVLKKAGFRMIFELADIAVEPDRFSEIEAQTDLVKRVKDFMRPRILPVIRNDGILKHMIFFPDFGP